jgi:hypothetical protein
MVGAYAPAHSARLRNHLMGWDLTDPDHVGEPMRIHARSDTPLAHLHKAESFIVDRSAPVPAAFVAGDGDLVRGHARRSPASSPSCACRSEACHCSLADQVALELSQRSENMEDEFAAGRGGVDALLHAAEADTPSLYVCDRVDQVPERAAESIKLPHHERIARPELIEHLEQLGTLVENAAGFVDEDAIAADGLQRIELQLRLRVGGGDAGVAEQVAQALDCSRTRLHGTF